MAVAPTSYESGLIQALRGSFAPGSAGGVQLLPNQVPPSSPGTNFRAPKMTGNLMTPPVLARPEYVAPLPNEGDFNDFTTFEPPQDYFNPFPQEQQKTEPEVVEPSYIDPMWGDDQDPYVEPVATSFPITMPGEVESTPLKKPSVTTSEPVPVPTPEEPIIDPAYIDPMWGGDQDPVYVEPTYIDPTWGSDSAPKTPSVTTSEPVPVPEPAPAPTPQPEPEVAPAYTEPMFGGDQDPSYVEPTYIDPMWGDEGVIIPDWDVLPEIASAPVYEPEPMPSYEPAYEPSYEEIYTQEIPYEEPMENLSADDLAYLEYWYNTGGGGFGWGGTGGIEFDSDMPT